MKWTSTLALAAVGLSLAATPVRAQLSGASTSTTGATCTGGGSTSGDCRNSSALTTNTSSQITSRYAWNINADVAVLSTHDTSGTAQHHVSFTATAPGGYRLDIST